MADETYEIAGTTILELSPDGPLLSSERDALDVISAAYGGEATMVAVPAARLAPEFFQLRTGLAGAFIQKVVNYSYRLAIIGDISSEVEQSTALRDFVYESNKGRQVVFARDREELARLL